MSQVLPNSCNDIESFVVAFLEFTRATVDSPRYHELFWTFEKFYEASHNDPHLCLSLVLAVLDKDQDDKVVADIAAGPMEDLLVYHGPAVIDRLEALVAERPIFRKLLAGVWRNDIDKKVWKRVLAVRGEPW